MDVNCIESVAEATDPLISEVEIQNNVTMEAMTVHYTGINQDAFDEKYQIIPKESPTVKSALKKMKARYMCSRTCLGLTMKRHVPVIDLLTSYRFKEYIAGDIVAGISLGVLSIPMGMGLALLATLPPIVGLYTSFFPVLVYFLFGRSRYMSVGTMALVSLIIASAINKAIPEVTSNAEVTNATNSLESEQSVVGSDERLIIAMSLSCLSGILLVAMSLLRLGNVLASYISEPFLSGYMSGCSIIMITHQMKFMLGISVGNYSGPLVLIYTIRDICRNLRHTNIATLVTSILAIITLFTVKKFINERYIGRLRIPVPIDIIVVIIATTISYLCDLEDKFGIEIISEIPQGLPPPAVPSTLYMGTLCVDAFVLGLVSYVQVTQIHTVIYQ